jgi:hypothetical protein
MQVYNITALDDHVNSHKLIIRTNVYIMRRILIPGSLAGILVHVFNVLGITVHMYTTTRIPGHLEYERKRVHIYKGLDDMNRVINFIRMKKFDK